MVNVLEAAGYIYNKYLAEYGEKIDEMKLHKLLYFAQRESIIQTGKPLFDATFYGWKFGPVLKEIREAYRDNNFPNEICAESVNQMLPVMDSVLSDYADKKSWSLSRLTHGEVSWKNSRQGVAENENSDNPMRLSDIVLDAERIKSRREMLNELGLS